ncbi:Formamidase [Pseudolycoriella hygida]|uniref:Formamidase n=1 Tax=Pseudolycoriella hygida TaxID=35572 RepID=A0A9Q0NG07_9DIPT|nr:Formamidase [Pseudolycoriella hygida]
MINIMVRLEQHFIFCKFILVAIKMPPTLVSVDLKKSAENQPIPMHNRWHPSIPPVARVRVGEPFRMECMDWTGGQIKNNDSTDDIENVDLAKVHVLSGPIYVEGAEPNDLLVVDFLDIGTFPQMEWGYTGIFPTTNGGGFLTDLYPKAAKAIWDFEGRHATSRHIPGVRLSALMHPGIIGCAPSMELLNEWNKRESKLVAKESITVPPRALLPEKIRALVGTLKGSEAVSVAREAARTIPPREHGGNCDIKNLTIGSRVYLPVYVPGANLSVGDLHFCQGDGEISFCGAIEMAGYIDLKLSLIKNGVIKYKQTNAMFAPSASRLTYGPHLVFEGISVDETGRQYYLDANVAYRQATLNAIEYLKTQGYTGEQAYLLLSAAPVEGHLNSLVDVPNSCCTLSLPLEIFDRDISPKVDVTE